MEIKQISYKFKICVTTEDYNRALKFLESISTFIEELYLEDIELIKRLKKGITRQYRKYFTHLKKNTETKILKSVNESYYNKVVTEGQNIMERFVLCLNSLSLKVRDQRLLPVMYKLQASLFNCMQEFCEDNRSKFIETAYHNYLKCVEFSLQYLDKFDIIRLKIFYSYCKFLFFGAQDKYRAMLICINIINEIHKKKNEEEFMDDEINRVEFEKIDKKFRTFYESNLEEYNKVMKIYHPEYN